MDRTQQNRTITFQHTETDMEKEGKAIQLKNKGEKKHKQGFIQLPEKKMREIWRQVNKGVQSNQK